MALYAFDGTWNSAVVDDDEEGQNDTNVARFYEAYEGSKWYVSGPGTRLGRLGKALGGFMGMGARERVEEAYRQLGKDYASGDRTIDIVGFSRGAAIALDFANLINENGVRDVDNDTSLSEQATIRFIGLWDVVGAFGIPVGERVFQRLNVGHKLSVPPNVTYAFHALAMDDRRQSFRPTRQLNAYEVWFRGAHSDVGGGNGNVALSCIALRWMLRKARAADLPIDESAITACDAFINADAPVRLPGDLIQNAYRQLWENDRIHYTVADREAHNNAPADYPRESEADELTAVACGALPSRKPPTRAPQGSHVITPYVPIDD